MPVHTRAVRGNLIFFNGANRLRVLDAIGPDVFKYEEDFTKLAAASDAIAGYTITLVEAGAGETTVTIPDGSGGTLLITTDNFDNDGANLQRIGEAFGFATTNYLTYFGIRFKCSEATQSDFLVGLCITDTDLLGGMTDGVYFEKLDGGTGISFTTEKNSTETQTDSLATFAADTWIVLEFCWDGSTVKAMVNGTVVATHSANVCDDELLTPSIQYLAGSAAISTMTVDWVRAIQVGR